MDNDSRPNHGSDGSQWESEHNDCRDLQNIIAEKCSTCHVHHQNASLANLQCSFFDVAAPFFPFIALFLFQMLTGTSCKKYHEIVVVLSL